MNAPLPFLTLNEETHTYTDATGAVWPGVTSILGELTDFSHVPADTLEYARQLGTAVHDATEYHDRGTLDLESVDSAVMPYLVAYWSFLDHEKPEVLGIEELVWHSGERYAGKLDRRMVLRGRRSILDVKTPKDVRKALVGPQTAAYLRAFNRMLYLGQAWPDMADQSAGAVAARKEAAAQYEAEKYERRYALQLKHDGTYTLHELTDPADFDIFRSCQNIRAWRQKHGIANRR
jgi:hypothetical protein